MKKVQDRFIEYTKIDTESSFDKADLESMEKQIAFGKLLVEEMKNIGIEDAYIDEYGYVYGTIPSNVENKNIPTIGYLAHMDTSQDLSGKNVNAKIISKYDGKDIIINQEKNITMKASDFENLSWFIGEDLIVTDGNTLLGADDKAGIAEILTVAEILMKDNSIKHGNIRIGFTPNEEVGRGTDNFDVEKFGADFAYTIDGGKLGDIKYDNFNAADAFVEIKGISMHPGSAKNKLVNSILIATEFNSMLPIFENPAITEGYEGFNHIVSFNGTVELTKLKYIIRDHDLIKFNNKKDRFIKIANYINEKYGNDLVKVNLVDSYYNMKEKVLPKKYIIDIAEEVMNKLGIYAKFTPIRGGTDGARLSYMGLPCPNICAGGLNPHSKYEFISIQSMEKVVQILIEISNLCYTKFNS